jgi:tRNA-dependent cyclodipeptide synthase
MPTVQEMMVSYRVTVTHSPGWRRHGDGILLISVGKEYHEGIKLSSTIAWARARFESLYVLLADTLQRHNDPASDAEAVAKALAAGDAWLTAHAPELEATGKLRAVARWNELLCLPAYGEVLAQFRRIAVANETLREAVRVDIRRFLDRQVTLRPDSAERSESYLLEELAAITLHARRQPGARLYPSRNLESFRVVEAGLVPEAPRGLEKQQRVELCLERRGCRSAEDALGVPHGDATSVPSLQH